jgi:hypothetical protein
MTVVIDDPQDDWLRQALAHPGVSRSGSSPRSGMRSGRHRTRSLNPRPSQLRLR